MRTYNNLCSERCVAPSTSFGFGKNLVRLLNENLLHLRMEDVPLVPPQAQDEAGFDEVIFRTAWGTQFLPFPTLNHSSRKLSSFKCHRNQILGNRGPLHSSGSLRSGHLGWLSRRSCQPFVRLQPIREIKPSIGRKPRADL